MTHLSMIDKQNYFKYTMENILKSNILVDIKIKT